MIQYVTKFKRALKRDWWTALPLHGNQKLK